MCKGFLLISRHKSRTMAKENSHKENDGCCGNCSCSHNHGHDHHEETSKLKMFLPEILSAVLMVVSLCIEWTSESAEIFAYIVSVLPVGFPILASTFKEWREGDFFNEFTLMIVACVGAFLIGEFPEGVAILLFYSIGEKLEDIVSGDVKGQIKRLLGKMPKEAAVIKDGTRSAKRPEEVSIGEVIAVKPGENVPLDGILISEGGASFNTAAITGESVPRFYEKGSEVFSGIIPIDTEVFIRTNKPYADSSMKRIMEMIEDASSHRAPSETILRKITRWYTPVVLGAAVLLFVIPWIVGLCSSSFTFEWYIWLKRSLVFLVCSCPCALIVSIPLTYFASIGIASSKGILFKGHDSLDAMRKVDTVLLDKTGTVTTGDFHVEEIKSLHNYAPDFLLQYVASIEQSSSHPLAEAILREAGRLNVSLLEPSYVKTEPHGMSAGINGKNFIIGSNRIFERHSIPYDETGNEKGGTRIYIAIDGKAEGMIILSDTVKSGVADAVSKLKKSGVSTIGILSGDDLEAVEKARTEINADFAKGKLLPADKNEIIGKLKREGHKVAFAGDGINDAPALAASDVGIAMGNLGTDLAIESASMVIAGDDLRKIDEGIDISRKVKNVIIENVGFAFGVKLTVMILGAFGIASLWAAVFADTGVTVVTVLWTLYRLRIWELKKKPKI